MGNHERCRLNPYIQEYAGKLGSFALNTARVIQHEVTRPKPEYVPAPLTDSELVILDDETAIIRPRDLTGHSDLTSDGSADYDLL